MFKKICVFCGSNPGSQAVYGEATEDLGRLLAREKITLVYGGSKVGLMGRLADAVLAAGGEVIGVIPYSMIPKEIAHAGLTNLRIVDSMHQRKALMAELADGFVALPGGFGTFEEFCEILTWAQLGLHRKPCGILNVNGYYDHLLGLLDHAVNEKFIRPAHRSLVIAEQYPESLLAKMETYQTPQVDKWITRSTT